MSKVSISGNNSGTGTFTIAAPNSNNNRQIDLPDLAGTVLTDATDLEPQVKTSLNATGDAPVYACRAWVNFQGIDPLIRDSGNVSSITDNGTGDFTINFTSAIQDTNYAFLFGGQLDGTFNNDTGAFGTKRSDFTGGKLTTSIRVICHSNGSLTQEDPLYFTGAIFR